ncbi:MAG: alpha-L-arabinofuranosidase C-terminal domain-containing protein, partial [Anaerolineae bacterium]|nr:alpha-L-arabinofuranosidase C-terminal domain-containing protein [Anaerolineae bacterium]
GRVPLGPDWSTVSGRLDLPRLAQVSAATPWQFAITAPAGANVVLDRVLLYPDDHVAGADPDVIRFLREARLPILRWPGGNFSSGYHWRDGIGPVDSRPTRDNPAWEGLEYNLFGTDEFIAFCRAVGCQPLICVNGGDGTPEEAAAWVQYCNGPPDTPMGRLRAQNGHPEPYRVHYWEIGNELGGRWQVTWTTPRGYADRYRRCAAAMRAADPTIRLLACGSMDGEATDEWNERLIEEAGAKLEVLTDHLLTGGLVDQDTDPVELYHAFMGYASALPAKYRAVAERMRQAGVKEPRVAITELQLFADFRGPVEPMARLAPATMPAPATISEALYDATIIHACIRMGDLVELLTHSATVNHGGGLRKVRERVWANPCHYGHAMGVALAGGTPLKVRLACDVFSTGRAYGRIRPHRGHPVLDAMAVLSQDGAVLYLMLVHLSATSGPIDIEIDLGDLAVQRVAELVTLCGEAMHDQNTPYEPERVVPRASALHVQGRQAFLSLKPFSLTRVAFRLSDPAPDGVARAKRRRGKRG